MTQEGTATAANGNSSNNHDDLRGRAGIAPIKAEYLLPVETKPRPVVDDDAAEERGDSRDTRADSRDQPSAKRQKTGKGFKKRTEQRAKPQGEAAIKMCRAWETTGECARGDACRFQHSWAGYWEVKPTDIHHEVAAQLADSEPFVRAMAPHMGGEDLMGKTIDMTTQCPVFKDLGYCTYGWRCRFLGGHIRKHDDKEGADQWELLGFKDPSSMSETERYNETNWPKSDTLTRLKHNKFDWTFSIKYLAKIEPDKPFALALPKGSVPNPKYAKKQKAKQAAATEMDEESAMNEMNEEEAMNAAPAAPAPAAPGIVDGESEAMDVPLRPEEKRRLDWENGRYLAPLTTVGNLPFRRLCVDYGATITISEMALAQPLVTGQTEEWALLRRHHSEKMFGVQLAGGYPNRMVPAAEVIAKELGPSGVDFVDINMGCPIDLLFNQGAGSALMENPGRLGKILVGMNRALGETEVFVEKLTAVPLTVKFRTGVAHNRPTAHKLIPKFATEWGASAMTLHGRSRQQRYSRLANWEYVRECVDVLHAATEDANMPRVPIFGNGDCFSAQSYWEEKERSGVDGVMVARGALIKPWIFTEIAERREWDISATERLEGIRKFAEYGLSHWGSDTMGVNTTRRFLCEALSFQCRYVPIGLLERMPPMMNERPPAYRGRNELETLLSSPNVADWIKISEMFLGPVGDNFTFVPKHKSSSYGNEEAQG